jgi:glycosyltransferase involved in cell wall biosynthesis
MRNLWMSLGWRRLRNTARNLMRHDLQAWFDPKFRVRFVPWVGNRYVPDGDVIIATAWPTAYSVAKLAPTKGRKAYFIQHYETWSGPVDLVDGSYKLPLKHVTVATWLQELMVSKFSRPRPAMVTQGVNTDHFDNPRKVDHSPKRVLMLYSPHSWKGIEDGVTAFEIARQTCPDTKLVMFGLRRGPGIPPGTEFHESPPQASLKNLYSSCDVFLSPSWSEGCQLPPMEAMACRCAVVATNVGGIPDYAVAEKTVLASPPRNPNRLAENLIRLLTNPDLLFRVGNASYDHIRQFTWERAALNFETILAEMVASDPVTAV